jgi:hypothetical protein
MGDGPQRKRREISPCATRCTKTVRRKKPGRSPGMTGGVLQRFTWRPFGAQDELKPPRPKEKRREPASEGGRYIRAGRLGMTTVDGPSRLTVNEVNLPAAGRLAATRGARFGNWLFGEVLSELPAVASIN